MKVSPNFSFLKVYDLQLVQLGSQAELYFSEDPNTCLIKLRQFGEFLAQLVAAKAGLYEDPNDNQLELLRRLESQGALSGQALELFHSLRKVGNDAVHSFENRHGIALSHLKYARNLGIWFHRFYGGAKNFKPGAFHPPEDPQEETESLKQELQRLRQQWQESEAQAKKAEERAAEEAELRALAEALLEETESENISIKEKLEQFQAETLAQPKKSVQKRMLQANSAAQDLELDERETRRLIDGQLRKAGWEVDSENLHYGKGTRPQKGKYRAIAEWPTASGPVDYALFAGLVAIGVIEAKRQSKDVAAYLEQAKRYSRGFQLRGEAEFPEGSPWGEYGVPFIFSTNGRPYLKQLATKSGIWFWDGRSPQVPSRPSRSWYSPQDLLDVLGQNHEMAQKQLAAEGFNYDFNLRPYQIQAIGRVETALGKHQRSLLLAMATGTGKTKTAIALIYRLLTTKRFRRILFLVDRTALGDQAHDAFHETRMESQQLFADIFEVKSLKDSEIDRDTKVHICTVQAMVKRLLYPPDDGEVLTAGQYDCIVVDECHRGYLLDQELSDLEIEFRDEQDYVSKYRQVIEFFDAVKIGLTATPALHTKEIFGEPVFKYSYRQAVIDGYLIDHEPPIKIVTELAEEGIHWQAGDEVQYFDPKTGAIDLDRTPDELNFEVGQFNKRVINSNFDQVICEQLAGGGKTLKHFIDLNSDEKTLIFCVRDDHADRIVAGLKEAIARIQGGCDDDAIVKITGAADHPGELIRRFKNEKNPKVVVTVDLLTTGIDVPKICNLVFLRRVNSRILYEQMIGRATRLCEEINKEVFRIFDGVNLYHNLEKFTDMKPVVQNPKLSFGQLFSELETVTDDQQMALVVDQLLAKLQRKKRHLSEDQNELIAQVAGAGVGALLKELEGRSPSEKAAFLRERRELAQLLDRRDGGHKPILISTAEDRLLRIERGYGEGCDRPEDYLDGFSAFIRENMNKIPALAVVTQRPKELTREDLKNLKLALDRAGFTEANLQTAWREKSNADIAASLIGFIRQAALGDPLVPYSERVDRAITKIAASQPWNQAQRKWLERIGKQLKQEKILEPESFNEGAFRSQGGLKKIDKIFEGQLKSILEAIKSNLWSDSDMG